LNLTHDPIGEIDRRREMRQVFQHEQYCTRLIELRFAARAFPDVRPEGLHAKAHLSVEEEIDFVWSQVSV